MAARQGTEIGASFPPASCPATPLGRCRRVPYSLDDTCPGHRPSPGTSWRAHRHEGVPPISTEKITQQAEQARQNLATARTAESRRKVEWAEAEASVAAIEAKWTRGDESIPASALTAARDAATRAASLLAAATHEVKKAARDLINDDPALAAAVVHALGGKFNGVPVHAITVQPSTPKVKDLPVAYVVHTKVGGALAGEVEFVLFGPEFMGKPDAADLVERLRKGGTFTDRYDRPRFTHTAHGAVHEYRTALQVTSARPELPHWPDAGAGAKDAGKALAQSLGEFIHTATTAERGVQYPVRVDWRPSGDGTVGRSKASGVGLTDTALILDLDFRALGLTTRTSVAAAEVRNDVARTVTHLASQWAQSGGWAPHVQSIKVTQTDAGAGHMIPTKVEFGLRSRDNALTLGDLT